MTAYEKLNNVMEKVHLDAENADSAYYRTEKDFIAILAKYLTGKAVECPTYGKGKVESVTGTTVDTALAAIIFDIGLKKFSLLHILTISKFVKFVDSIEVTSLWNAIFEVHSELTTTYKNLKETERQLAREALKKAEQLKKSEAKYQQQKEKAIKDFDKLVFRAKESLMATDEFYYSLGWLAKNAGTFSAVLPDYLLSAFERQFGADYTPMVVDSKKRTVGGYSMQWSLGMKAAISSKASNMPAQLIQHLSSNGKFIANTEFIWDLVDNYGFKFGKKQDIDHIKSHIPKDYLASFEAGLTA